jgi:hypothetical protein
MFLELKKQMEIARSEVVAVGGMVQNLHSGDFPSPIVRLVPFNLCITLYIARQTTAVSMRKASFLTKQPKLQHVRLITCADADTGNITSNQTAFWCFVRQHTDRLTNYGLILCTG